MFESGADAVAQLGGGGFGEGYGGNPVERGRAAAHEFEDAVNKAGGLACAGARLDEKRLVKRGCDALSFCIVLRRECHKRITGFIG